MSRENAGYTGNPKTTRSDRISILLFDRIFSFVISITIVLLILKPFVKASIIFRVVPVGEKVIEVTEFTSIYSSSRFNDSNARITCRIYPAAKRSAVACTLTIDSVIVPTLVIF
jgi:hypothetical protein